MAYAAKLLVTDLPVGNDWIDHLEILSAVRRIYFTAQPKFEEMMFRKLSGYVCVGINKESEDYKKALGILTKHRMSENILVENDLLKGYVRIPIPDESRIQELQAIEGATGSVRQINGQEIIALKQIWSLYSQDSNLLAKVKSNFVIELQKRAALNKIRLWWNRIPMEIELTQVGNVLAHANAQRIDNSVPDFL